MRREKAWVLPKGKLMSREHPRDAAKREVLEETGHDVSVHEFLGSMSYAVEGKIKIVQFWLMRATGPQVRELMDDVKAVKWLPLRQAIDILSRPHEKVFLTHVGPIALSHARKARHAKRTGGKKSQLRLRKGAGRPARAGRVHRARDCDGRQHAAERLRQSVGQLDRPRDPIGFAQGRISVRLSAGCFKLGSPSALPSRPTLPWFPSATIAVGTRVQNSCCRFRRHRRNISAPVSPDNRCRNSLNLAR